MSPSKADDVCMGVKAKGGQGATTQWWRPRIIATQIQVKDRIDCKENQRWVKNESSDKLAVAERRN